LEAGVVVRGDFAQRTQFAQRTPGAHGQGGPLRRCAWGSDSEDWAIHTAGPVDPEREARPSVSNHERMCSRRHGGGSTWPTAAGPSRSWRMSRSGLFGPAVCRLRSSESGPQGHSRKAHSGGRPRCPPTCISGPLPRRRRASGSGS
jgi:hypothetical protein